MNKKWLIVKLHSVAFLDHGGFRELCLIYADYIWKVLWSFGFTPLPLEQLDNEVTTRPKRLSELKLPSRRSGQLYIPMSQNTQASACKLLTPRISKGRPFPKWGWNWVGHRHMAHIFLLTIFFPLTQAAAAFWRAMFTYDDTGCFWVLKWSSSDRPVWYHLFGIRLLLPWLPLWV